MRMLGEMAVALPAVGLFLRVCAPGLERPAGARRAGRFLTGWMYWYFWVIVVALEAVAGAGLVRFWLPERTGWLISLAAAVADRHQPGLGAVLRRVRVLVRLDQGGRHRRVPAAGGVYVLGLWPGPPSVANLTAHGGFAPNGILPVLTGAVAATGFYFGAEIVHDRRGGGGRAGQGRGQGDQLGDHPGAVLLCRLDPAGGVPGALEFGRHRDALRQRAEAPWAFPAAAHIMNAVVLTAVLSALNSGLYASSRMLFA
jgi:GABA permease